MTAFPVVEGPPDENVRPLRNGLLHVGVGFFVAIAIDLSEELVELLMEASAALILPRSRFPALAPPHPRLPCASSTVSACC